MDSLAETAILRDSDEFDDGILPALDMLTDCHYFIIECQKAAAALDAKAAIEALN